MVARKEYEVLPDGGVKLYLPSGVSVRSALKPELLEQTGYVPRVAPPAGRLAFGDTPRNDGSGGAGNVPESRADVGPTFGQGGAPGVGPGGGTEGQASVETPEPGAKPLAAPPKELPQAPPAEKQRISVPDSNAGAAGAYVGGAPRRTLVLPGGFPRVSAQVQRGAEGLLPSPEDRKTANDLIDGAYKQQATAEMQSMDISNRAMDAAEQLRVNAEKAIALRREKIVKDLNNRRELLTRDMAEIENSKVDPKRFYRDRGGFAKALSFVAALAGGIRAGIQGGENQYLRRMDELAKRDIDAQIEMRGLKERGIKVRSTELDKLTDLMMGDQDAAAAQLRLQYGAMGDQLLREAAKQSGNRQVQAKLEMILAERYQQRQMESAQLWQQFGTKTVENFARVAPQVIQTGGGAPRSKREIELADNIKSGTVRVRGKLGLVRGKPDSTTVRFRQDAFNKMEAFTNDLGGLRGLAEQAQSSANPQMVSEVRRRIASLQKKLSGEESVLIGQGGMTTEEIGRIKESLSGLESLFSRDTIGGEGISAIDETQKSWERAFTTAAENSLLEMPGDPKQGVQPWQDEAGYYDENRYFSLPPMAPQAEPRVRD